jgi:hypothetical protein
MMNRRSFLAAAAAERRLGRRGMAERYMNWPLKLAEGSEDLLSVPGPILEQDHYTLREFSWRSRG